MLENDGGMCVPMDLDVELREILTSMVVRLYLVHGVACTLLLSVRAE